MLHQLLANDDLAVAVLGNFTKDASKDLRHVCKAFARATYLNVKWQPFHGLEPALDRLRRRYDLDERWFAPVEQVVRALYRLQEQNAIEFHLPSVQHHAMNVLGVNCMAVWNYATFSDTLVELVSTHPAFDGHRAGPYEFLETNPPWAAWAVLRDIGFRHVVASAMLPQGHPLGYLDWVATRDNAHAQLLARLRELRAAAAVARRRRTRRLVRLARQLA